MAEAKIAVIIPTYNQPAALEKCLFSMLKWTKSSFNIYIIDNSEEKYVSNIVARNFADFKNIMVFESKENLGWIKAVNLGIKNTTEPYILMMNDDTQILDFDELWLQNLLESFNKIDKLGAVGPSSNHVMGIQNIAFHAESINILTTILSGFCLLVKRSVFDEVGLLDENLSGGDDVELSIRIRKAGYFLSARKDTFIYHHHSLTGSSVYGSDWNSQAYTDKLNKEIIRKHGLKKFIEAYSFRETRFHEENDYPDSWERDTMQKYLIGKVVDVGCGNRKISEDAIGVDVTPKGETGGAGNQLGQKSQADITVKDIKLPFKDGEIDTLNASHVLEHITDIMAALKEWVRVVKPHGRLIITVPDEDVVNGMPLDPSHKHAINEESLRDMLGYVCKYKVLDVVKHSISFVMVVEIWEAK